jgi:hypothetical protein
MSVEIIEAEKEEPRPEALAKEAVDAIELRDKSEPELEWSDKVKEWLKPKNFKADSKTAGWLALGITKNLLRGVYEFASVAIKKKGNIGFEDGYKIGKHLFDFGKSEKAKE